MEISSRQGKVTFRGFDTWFEEFGHDSDLGISAGDRQRLPVVILHGGPGATHQYLEPLRVLAESGRRVIFYDQIGCGRSDRPMDPSFYTVQTFVDELDALRAQLNLERVHLLGQSWGGMLAMEYALRATAGLTAPAGLASIIVANSPASMPLWVSEANRLRAELPPEVEATLKHHERDGTTSDPAYAAAVDVFYRRHVCRVDPYPDCFNRTGEALQNDGFVYNLMNGPSEFHCIGTLKDWDITDQLHNIRTPTLLLSGKFDEATPTIVRSIHERIPGSEWILFEQSSHTPHLEEPAAFNGAVRGFLAGIEAR